MFEFVIFIVSLIISIFLITLLYNIIDKFVYSVTRKKISKFNIFQYILLGVLLTFLFFLEYDLVSGLIQFL